MEGVFAVFLLTMGTAEMSFIANSWGDMIHIPFAQHSIHDARKLKEVLNRFGQDTKNVHVLEIKKTAGLITSDYDGIYIDNSPSLKTAEVCHVRWERWSWSSLGLISRECEPLTRNRKDDDEENSKESDPDDDNGEYEQRPTRRRKNH